MNALNEAHCGETLLSRTEFVERLDDVFGRTTRESEQVGEEDLRASFQANIILQHVSFLKSTPMVSQVHSILLDNSHHHHNNGTSHSSKDGKIDGFQNHQNHQQHQFQLSLAKFSLFFVILCCSPIIGMMVLFYVSWFLVRFGLSKLIVDVKETIEFYFGEDIHRVITFFHSESLQSKVTQAQKMIHDKLNMLPLNRVPQYAIDRACNFIAYPVAFFLALKDGTAAFPRKRKHEDPSAGMTLFILDESIEARKRRRKVMKSNNNNGDRNQDASSEEEEGTNQDLQDVVEDLQVTEGKDQETEALDEQDVSDQEDKPSVPVAKDDDNDATKGAQEAEEIKTEEICPTAASASCDSVPTITVSDETNETSDPTEGKNEASTLTKDQENLTTETS